VRDCRIPLEQRPWDTVTIRNLDDKVIERLEDRAKNHRRSLEAELRDLLSHAAQQPLPSMPWSKPIVSPP
jgi:hypothetical protein